jgi:predicted DNA-binding protein YlxM (UPF0122 family)
MNKKSPLQKKEERKRLRPKISLADIYTLCKRNVSLSDIANKFGISPISTATYIERLLRKGYEVNIDLYVQSAKRNEIEETFLTLQTPSIKRIKESLQDRATEEEIRIVRGYMQGKQRTE